MYRYHELTKNETRDYVSCHPLLIFVQNSLGMCSINQKISRMFAFGNNSDRLLAIKAVLSSPQEIAVDNVCNLIDIISFSTDVNAVAAAIISLNAIMKERQEMSLYVMRHKSLGVLLRRLWKLNHSWEPILSNFYAHLASSMASNGKEIDNVLEFNIAESILQDLQGLIADAPRMHFGAIVQFLSVLASHASIANCMSQNRNIMEILESISITNDFGAAATQVLYNISHVVSSSTNELDIQRDEKLNIQEEMEQSNQFDINIDTTYPEHSTQSQHLAGPYIAKKLDTEEGSIVSEIDRCTSDEGGSSPSSISSTAETKDSAKDILDGLNVQQPQVDLTENEINGGSKLEVSKENVTRREKSTHRRKRQHRKIVDENNAEDGKRRSRRKKVAVDQKE